MFNNLPKLNWPQTSVMVALIAGAVAVALYAPPDVRAGVVGVLTAIAGWLHSPRNNPAE